MSAEDLAEIADDLRFAERQMVAFNAAPESLATVREGIAAVEERLARLAKQGGAQ